MSKVKTLGARGTGSPSGLTSFVTPDLSSEEVRLLAACFTLLAVGTGDLERDRDLERDSFLAAAAEEALPPFPLLSESVESVLVDEEDDCFCSTKG